MRFVRDEAVQLLEVQYLEAERKAAAYAARSYWTAATRWADVASRLYEAIHELGWHIDVDITPVPEARGRDEDAG
jgi:hypothetical protein